MLLVNHPATVAEVTACCEAYERALIANDVAALKAFFWDSPQAIRFGTCEQLYGTEAISAFRESRVIDFSGRRPLRLSVLALGPDVAVAMFEFTVERGGETRHGRQMQVWARFADAGWRVTSAHVSFLPPDPAVARALSAAQAIGLPLQPAHLPGAVAQLKRTTELVAPLLAFPLPESNEPAAIFTP